MPAPHTRVTDYTNMQTKTEIKRYLAAAGSRPLKRFGQHFLIDGNLMRKLVSAASPAPGDVVLEVGVATGSLTALLADTGSTVIGIDIDKKIVSDTAARFGDHDNVQIESMDALAGKHHINPQLISLLRDHPPRNGGRMMMVSNLPYNIASPLLVELLWGGLDFDSMVFTVQREVANRLAASPNSRAYGALSVLIQLQGTVEKLARIRPSSFWPKPTVESSMLRINPHAAQMISAPLREFVRCLFAHPRKTLARIFRDSFNCGDANQRLLDQGIDPSRRPGTLNLEEIVQLFKRLDWSAVDIAARKPLI